MKIRSALIIAGVVIGLSQLVHAQCPEICDSNQNTALGDNALLINNTGVRNTALGFQALRNNNADSNTATGYQALLSNSSGAFNTANGVQALLSATVASENTAVGAFALAIDISGANNTAVGYQALSRSTTANNTAVGWNALGEARTGQSNTAVGSAALSSNTGGSINTAVGNDALARNTTGLNNIALGDSAGFNLVTGSNNIDIGNLGVGSESNTIRIGRREIQVATYIAGISGRTVGGGVGVLIDSNGHLGTNTSSARFKEQIKSMDKASEAILSLKPVTFRYKEELDPAGIPQFGLVAEEVAKVNPDLVARDDKGKPYTVRYEAVNAMLLNEFLKEHRAVQELKSTVADQQREIAALGSSLKEQAAQMRAVSAELKRLRPAPRLVVK